ncbi:alpha/beta fold hydrolase [Streptomyces lydicamycinicus]|uniref:alpha/beta fold hydrolase n=1 Tax=Streptomyces lydicamycinicus TaxID=1546107 RepID=UPI003C30C0AB
MTTTFVLIPGAACDSWHWHLLAAELRARGRAVVSVDLPCEDDAAGLEEYADAVVAAVAGRGRLTLVAHSFAGFTAPLVCARVPVDLLVLLAAMVPLPGEAPQEWWAATKHPDAQVRRAGRAAQRAGGGTGAEGVPEAAVPGSAADPFFQDLPPDLAAEAAVRWRRQSETPAARPWPMAAWPPVDTRFLLCRQDRLFPAPFLRALAAERLGLVPDEMEGGHFPMLSRPIELADRLEGYSATTAG